MEDKEKLIVYSNTSSVFTYSAEIRPNFKISVSQSQGFAWNQDLFATQYQQSYKVVYDAHEDNFDELILKIDHYEWDWKMQRQDDVQCFQMHSYAYPFAGISFLFPY